MVFVRTDKGCLICISHKTNHDGYLRKAWGNDRTGDREVEMFHRFIYRAHNGEIPEGFEVDHLCEVRSCCNEEHLEAIPGEDHAVKTNRLRYKGRLEAAKAHWEATGCSGFELGALFGVDWSTGFRWIRGWTS